MGTHDACVRGCRGRGLALGLVRVLVASWAGFWAWFVVADGFSHAGGGDPGSVAMALAGVVLLIGLATLAWSRPRIGGSALVAGGVGAAVFFSHPTALAILAAPAVGLGVLLVMLGGSGRRGRPKRCAPVDPELAASGAPATA